jgi:hypothetical protein
LSAEEFETEANEVLSVVQEAMTALSSVYLRHDLEATPGETNPSDAWPEKT